jgi:ornithine cyclodeaminase/alanine dehydrogenase
MALLLNEAEVTMLLPMTLALEAVEDAFRAHGEGKLTNKPRVRLSVPGGLLHVMPAALPDARVMGLKSYATVRGGTKFVVLLFSVETGALLAVIEADKLGQMRTGAASGVATKYLARPDADRVGCYGTGWQARSQLGPCAPSVGCGRCGSTGGTSSVARASPEMKSLLGVPVVAVDRPEVAARDASILVTIHGIEGAGPRGRWIEPGAHVRRRGVERAPAGGESTSGRAAPD